MSSAAPNLVGVNGRLFADPHPALDATSFQVDNTSQQYYRSPYYLAHKNQVQPVPAPRTAQPHVDLADVLGADVLGPITNVKKISFHAVGDTGAAKVNAFQTAAQALANEESMADPI